MALSSIIVDDSPKAISSLSMLLQEYCPQVEVVASAQNLNDAQNILARSDFDIAFLDIEMHESRTIFDILEPLVATDEVDYEIVFVTGMQEANYAVKALDMMALARLYKPVDPEKLRRVVEKVELRLTNPNQRVQLDAFLESLKSSSLRRQSLSIQLPKGDIQIVKLDEIKYIKGDGPISEFVLLDDNQKSVRGLGHYGSILEGHPDFHKFSQSLIVNLTHMARYNHRDHEIRMRDGKRLEASRRGGQAFRVRV